MSMSESLETLVARCKAGDSGSWDRLFRMLRAPILAGIVEVQPHLAVSQVERLYKDACMTLLAVIPSYHGEENLFSLSRNVARQTVRTSIHRGAVEDAGVWARLSADLMPDKALRGEQIALIDQLLDSLMNRLSDQEAQCFQEFYGKGNTIPKIAIELSRKRNQIDQELHRVRKKAREILRRLDPKGEAGLATA